MTHDDCRMKWSHSLSLSVLLSPVSPSYHCTTRFCRFWFATTVCLCDKQSRWIWLNRTQLVADPIWQYFLPTYMWFQTQDTTGISFNLLLQLYWQKKVGEWRKKRWVNEIETQKAISWQNFHKQQMLELSDGNISGVSWREHIYKENIQGRMRDRGSEGGTADRLGSPYQPDGTE